MMVQFASNYSTNTLFDEVVENENTTRLNLEEDYVGNDRGLTAMVDDDDLDEDDDLEDDDLEVDDLDVDVDDVDVDESDEMTSEVVPSDDDLDDDLDLDEDDDDDEDDENI